MERSFVTARASALALAAAILAGSTATASAATAQPGVCAAQHAALAKVAFLACSANLPQHARDASLAALGPIQAGTLRDGGDCPGAD